MVTNEVVVCILKEAATPIPLEHPEDMPGGKDAITPLVEHVFPDTVTRRNLKVALQNSWPHLYFQKSSTCARSSEARG